MPFTSVFAVFKCYVAVHLFCVNQKREEAGFAPQNIWIPCNVWRVDCLKHFYFIFRTEFLSPCSCVIGLLVAGSYKPRLCLFEERIGGEKDFKFVYAFRKKLRQLL